MKVANSLRSLKQRHRDCRVVRRKGRVYVINKTQPRYKARQGRSAAFALGRRWTGQIPNAPQGPGHQGYKGPPPGNRGGPFAVRSRAYPAGRDFPTHAALASSPSSALPSRRMHRLGRAHR